MTEQLIADGERYIIILMAMFLIRNILTETAMLRKAENYNQYNKLKLWLPNVVEYP